MPNCSCRCLCRDVSANVSLQCQLVPKSMYQSDLAVIMERSYLIFLTGLYFLVYYTGFENPKSDIHVLFQFSSFRD